MADTTFQSVLIHTMATVERPTRKIAADLQQVIEYASPHLTNAPCRFEPRSMILADAEVGYLLDAEWKMFCEPCDLRELDRVTWIMPTRTRKLIVKQVQEFYAEDGTTAHHFEVWLQDQEAITGA